MVTNIDMVGRSVGDVIRLDGKRYRLAKKTSTAVAVERWYWFDVFGDWLRRKLCA